MSRNVEEERYTVAVEKDVRVPMRDGTILRADVYHPEGKGRYPTIVTRTAYNKSRIDTRYYEEHGGVCRRGIRTRIPGFRTTGCEAAFNPERGAVSGHVEDAGKQSP